MSYGIVICSQCDREVHQEVTGWKHCEDGSPRCKGAVSAYPMSTDEILGKWCGKDDFFYDQQVIQKKKR